MAGFAKIGKFLVKNRAAIGFGIGTISGAAALVETVRKSRKTTEIVNEHKKNIEGVRRCHHIEERPKNDMTKEERKSYDRDRFKVYWNTTKKFGKNYALAGSLAALSFVSYRYSYKVQMKLIAETEKRLAVATAAASAWAKKYNDYRDEVIDRYGEQADFDIINKLNEGWEEVGKGKNKEKVKTYKEYSDDIIFVFDNKSCNFDLHNHDQNLCTVQAQLSTMQDRLDSYATDGYLIKDILSNITRFDCVTTPIDWDYLGYVPGDVIDYELHWDKNIERMSKEWARETAPAIIIKFKNAAPALGKIKGDDLTKKMEQHYTELKLEQKEREERAKSEAQEALEYEARMNAEEALNMMEAERSINMEAM